MNLAQAAVRARSVHRIAMDNSPTTQRRSASVPRVPTHCSTCNLREVCLPCGLNEPDIARLGDLVYTRKRVKRGESVYRAGAEFDALFAVRSGFLKSSVVLEDGRDQVTAFHMAG